MRKNEFTEREQPCVLMDDGEKLITPYLKSNN